MKRVHGDLIGLLLLQYKTKIKQASEVCSLPYNAQSHQQLLSFLNNIIKHYNQSLTSLLNRLLTSLTMAVPPLSPLHVH